MFKMKEKEANYALEKFNNDFEELRKQIVDHVNNSLNETKSRFINEIKEKLAVETNEEIRIRKEID
jgi:predicted small metal-binding protein